MPTRPTEVLCTRYALGDLPPRSRIVMAPLTRTHRSCRGEKTQPGLRGLCNGAGLIKTKARAARV